MLLLEKEKFVNGRFLDMEKNPLESTNKLLRVIIALLLRPRIEDVINQRDQIRILSDLEIKPAEIAEILGRTSKFINKELSVIKKTKGNSI